MYFFSWRLNSLNKKILELFFHSPIYEYIKKAFYSVTNETLHSLKKTFLFTHKLILISCYKYTAWKPCIKKKNIFMKNKNYMNINKINKINLMYHLLLLLFYFITFNCMKNVKHSLIYCCGLIEEKTRSIGRDRNIYSNKGNESWKWTWNIFEWIYFKE